jgi:hypothetical protein
LVVVEGGCVGPVNGTGPSGGSAVGRGSCEIAFSCAILKFGFSSGLSTVVGELSANCETVRLSCDDWNGADGFARATWTGRVPPGREAVMGLGRDGDDCDVEVLFPDVCDWVVDVTGRDEGDWVVPPPCRLVDDRAMDVLGRVVDDLTVWVGPERARPVPWCAVAVGRAWPGLVVPAEWPLATAGLALAAL